MLIYLVTCYHPLKVSKREQTYSDQKVASEEPFVDIVGVILVKKELWQVIRLDDNAA
jgi:hypothetical protein